MLDALQRWLTALRLVKHPNLARVYEVAAVDGLLFVVYEYIEGDLLAKTFGEAGMAFDLDTTLVVGRQVASALQHMHEHSIFYHWLDPRDIVLTRQGRVVLVDVALERFLRPIRPSAPVDDTPREQPDGGLWRYAAPEVLRGDSAGVAADVYSLAALLYRMAAGVTQQDADRWMTTVPQAGLRVLGQGLSRDPAGRQSSVDALVEAFERSIGTPLPVMEVLPALPRSFSALPRGWLVVLAIGLLALGLTGWLVWRTVTAPAAASTTAAPPAVAQPSVPWSPSPWPAAPTATPLPTAPAPTATATTMPLSPTYTPAGTDTPALTPRPVTDTPTPLPTTAVPTRTPTPIPTVTPTPSPSVPPSASATETPVPPPPPPNTRQPTTTVAPPTGTSPPPTDTPVPPPPTDTPVPPPPTDTPVPPPPTDTPVPPPPTDTPPPPP
jgi:hypothetical protein